jgi:hypothetical protein
MSAIKGEEYKREVSEEIKKEYETQKKPKTIFGRLFNYAGENK